MRWARPEEVPAGPAADAILMRHDIRSRNVLGDCPQAGGRRGGASLGDWQARRHQARVRIWLLGLTAAAAVAAGAVWQAVNAQTGAAAASADWHQWLGPNRNNISAETGWSTDWGEDGPKVLWRKKVGLGFSAVSVAKGLAYTMGNDGKSDTVWCFNADTGEQVWKKSYACGKGDHAGPRCTPTVDGDVVYTLSYYGHLYCFDAKKGKIVWSKDLGKELGLRPSKWGFASSPLVDGDRLIVSAGMVLALNKKDGKVIWKTPKTQAGYSSPVLMTVGGKKCLAIFSGTPTAEAFSMAPIPTPPRCRSTVRAEMNALSTPATRK